MQERLASYGLQERDVVGDGNCQLRAISHQLFQTEDRHVEVSFLLHLRLRFFFFFAARLQAYRVTTSLATGA